MLNNSVLVSFDFPQAMHIAAAIEATSRLLPHLHALHEALIEKVYILLRLEYVGSKSLS